MVIFSIVITWLMLYFNFSIMGRRRPIPATPPTSLFNFSTQAIFNSLPVFRQAVMHNRISSPHKECTAECAETAEDEWINVMSLKALRPRWY